MQKTKVAVIGSGMMGSSLAAMFTGNGFETVLITREKSLEKAMQNYTSVFKDLLQRKLLTEENIAICNSYLNLTSDYSNLTDVDFIFETVYESLEAKQAVYTEVEKYCKNLKALASSTSGMPADTLSSCLGKYEHLFVVAHPYNPPHLVPCIEIVKSRNSCEEAVRFTVELLEGLGKQVVILNKDYPGFIGNRLQYAMLREAIFMLEENVATPQMIDKTLKYSFAPRYTQIGLFEHFDNCGQDLVQSIQEYLNPTLCNASEPQKTIVDNCNAKNFGVKTGQGVLDWSSVDIQGFRDKAASPYYQFFAWNMPKKDAN